MFIAAIYGVYCQAISCTLSLPPSHQVTEDEVDHLATAIVPSCTSYSEDFAKFTYYPLISPETETIVVSKVVAWSYRAQLSHTFLPRPPCRPC